MMSYIALGHGKLLSLDDSFAEEKDFTRALHQFMRERGSPIDRIPSLGFKQIDLFTFYRIVEKLGGYEQVTMRQLWRQVYNELGANPNSTSAATCTRKHYERLLLPYERHVRGEEQIPVSPPRTLKRCYRSMYRETTPENLVAVMKEPQPVESPSWKDMPTSGTHNVNRVVLGYLPHVPAYEQLWQQHHPERAVPYSSVRDQFTTPSPAQSVHRICSDNSNHILEGQRWTLKRRVVERPVAPSPVEPKRHQANDDDGDRQELPLNLSSKRRVSEPSGRQDVHPDPSNASPCTTPRFLNHVSTLYPPHHIQKIEGPLKDPVHAPKPCTSGRASEVKNAATSTSAPQCMYLSNSNSQVNLKKDCLEDAKSGTHSSLDLTSRRACMMVVPERLAGCYSAPWDNDHHSLAKPPPRASAMRIIEVTQPSSTSNAWPIAAKPEGRFKASHMGGRPTCHKSEPQQQAQSDPAPRGVAYVFSPSLVKQKYSFNAGTGSTLVAAATKPELNPPLYGMTQQDHPSTLATSPGLRIEMSESGTSFPGSCRVNSRSAPTSTGGCRSSGSTPLGLINTGGHFEQCSLPGPTSSPRTAQESRSFEDMLQRRSEVKPWREQPLANGQWPLEVNLPRHGGKVDLRFDDKKPTQAVSYLSGALQKYLPLESHLKQVSGACTGGQRQTISSQQQGLALWSPPSLQRDGLGVTGQKGSPRVQTFCPAVVSWD
ncbi:uncharacterized protein LOC144821694 [Lissotriton helveticus]